MHESGIAYDLYATARRAAVEHGADRVIRVSVEFGELAMVNPEQVRFLFSVMVEEDPLFAGTLLEIETVPPVMTCDCGHYSGTDRYVCPGCGGLPRMLQGREVLVRNIEIDVRDGDE
ncbi:MAG TPA: hydrogenase maturation nickel metallochaperone HypA [Methanoregulaceae archaeon]|nr:hydrogenase maturation nickel metallochaperone HypA [Methanoregulaceae archaeon]HOV66888.1 hydrogenase maturation nickel metallochaperone HypA [Methanoregulaceae archaeon]HQJ86951.1 hydrogenase maturation nickel metallochaperone HypA [Methanoregulaceae archaeon]